MGLIAHSAYVCTNCWNVVVIDGEANGARQATVCSHLRGQEVVPASQLQGAVEALRQAEEDRDELRAEVARCHAALIDAGRRLDAAGGQ